VRRPQAEARLGEAASTGCIERERDPEVGDHGLSRLQQDVRRLDVAVDDTVGVRILERRGHVRGDPDCLVDRELVFAIETVPQRLPVHEWHDVPEEAVRPARVEQGQNVRVLKVGRRLDLGEEALGADRRRELGSEHLHGHRPAMLLVAGEIDRRRATRSELALDSIAPREGCVQAGDRV